MENYDWIRDPFNAELKRSIFAATKEEQVIDLSSETCRKRQCIFHNLGVVSKMSTEN
jgi:hypothetical protein